MPVERTTGGTSLIDVLDRVLDKGIVIDAWVRVSLVGIDLITVEARVVVASIDTYIKYSEAVGQVVPASRPAVDTRTHEALLAENAALRAQLARARPARRPWSPAVDGRQPEAGAASVSRMACVPRHAAQRLERGTPAAAEFLLASNDAAECARAGGRVARRAHRAPSVRLCAASMPAHTGLVGLAGAGLRSFDRAVARLDLDHSQHPLVGALNRTQPARPVSAHEPLGGLTLASRVPYGLLSPARPHLDEELRLACCSWARAPARGARGALGRRAAGPASHRLSAYRRTRRRAPRSTGTASCCRRHRRGVRPDPPHRHRRAMVIANTTAEEPSRRRRGRARAARGPSPSTTCCSRPRCRGPRWPRGSQCAAELLLVDPHEGSDLLFELMSAVVDDPQHGTGVVSILRNVTDLRRATEEIEENYRRLRVADGEMRAERDRLELAHRLRRRPDPRHRSRRRDRR